MNDTTNRVLIKEYDTTRYIKIATCRKSCAFISKLIEIHQHGCCEWYGADLFKQVLRCGRAAGILIGEAGQAQTESDFTHAMAAALRKAGEAEYWLMLLRGIGCLDEKNFNLLHRDCDELIRLLTGAVKISIENYEKE
jgi:four helix bundle protein